MRKKVRGNETMFSDIPTTAVNRRGKFFRLEDGSILPFTSMVDEKGKTTKDPQKCVVAIYKLPDGLFRGVDLRLFDDEMQEVTQ